MSGQLLVSAIPGTEEWVVRPQDADLIALWLEEDITVEYWPRERVTEPWARDSGADPHAAERDELSFRGYSFATQERGNMVVVFVDSIETYESATFVLLHELSHLHLPSWSPPTSKTLAQVEDEEDRADAVAGALMKELLGYDKGIREVSRGFWGTKIVILDEPDNRRVANPGTVSRCCPMRTS